DSVPLGRVRTQPTVKRFKRGLKRDYKRGGKISRLKKLIFLDKQVREFCKTANKKPKDKKGVIENHAHILLAALTSFTR
ncbi:TPA: hypothetical protein ACG3QW_003740, partial [Clostridioides difficile]